jgi:acetyl-CoA C-acetyltransferase
MRDVAIIGIGHTQFGELWDSSFREIGIQAGLEAIKDANLAGSEIDAMYVGNMSSGRFIDQHHIGALIADYSGMAFEHIPSTRIEAAGASGGIAFRQGVMAVASGMHDIVVVGGAEKMTDVSDDASNFILNSAADQQWESLMGATMSSLHAMIARRFIHEGLATREQIASVSVKNHDHGVLNPRAQFRRAISLDAVLRSPKVADPLTVFDCAPISDGAAAVVLCPLEMAKDYTSNPIKVLACSQSSDTLALYQREDICTFKATQVAAKRAYEVSGLGPKDIQVAEVHDNFTISELLALEDLGFFPRGKAGEAVMEGRTHLGGDIAVNTSGGLKARGDPIGATGVAQIVELVMQLRGEAGKRQVTDVRHALAHNVGGSGSAVVVSILGVA